MVLSQGLLGLLGDLLSMTLERPPHKQEMTQEISVCEGAFLYHNILFPDPSCSHSGRGGEGAGERVLPGAMLGVPGAFSDSPHSCYGCDYVLDNCSSLQTH